MITKKHLKQLILFGTFLISNQSDAQEIINLSTGWNNGLIPVGTVDDTWTVVIPNGNTILPRSCTLGAWEETGENHWVSPHTSNGIANEIGVAGIYTYKATFQVTSQTINCGTLVVKGIGGDNILIALTINGNNYPLTLPSGNHFQLTNENIMIFLNPADIITGTNNMKITVQNLVPPGNTPTYTGLNFCGSLHINDGNFNVLPTISGPNSICQGSPLTFNGSLAIGSSPSTDYVWQINECTATGSIISGGFFYESWFNGVPTSTFTFPSNINLLCGRYYKVTLAALRESACLNWASDTHLFKYDCKPAANVGPNQMICLGECVTLGNSGTSKGTSYSWTANGSVIGSGPNITVCPQVTTTYTFTATTSNGCSTTNQVTISVVQNVPDFSVVTNTANSSYFTVTATPVIMNANSVAGFGAFWSLQELDASNNPIFSIQNPAVWYPYPASLTFTGFNHPSQNYAGVISSLPSSPSIGRFRYNRKYLITRGTWNDACGWQPASYLILPKSEGESNGVLVESIITPDYVMMPDMMPDMMLAEVWQVSPNPSSNIFNVSCSKELIGMTVIDVFDTFGKKIDTKVIESGRSSISLDLGGNAKGVYILSITSNEGMSTHKLILE